jgi:hypothetical protein
MENTLGNIRIIVITWVFTTKPIQNNTYFLKHPHFKRHHNKITHIFMRKQKLPQFTKTEFGSGPITEIILPLIKTF